MTVLADEVTDMEAGQFDEDDNKSDAVINQGSFLKSIIELGQWRYCLLATVEALAGQWICPHISYVGAPESVNTVRLDFCPHVGYLHQFM